MKEMNIILFQPTRNQIYLTNPSSKSILILLTLNRIMNILFRLQTKYINLTNPPLKRISIYYVIRLAPNYRELILFFFNTTQFFFILYLN